MRTLSTTSSPRPSARNRKFPRRGFGARQAGFSLIELVAAFVVFALAFGVLMQILSASLRNASVSADYTQAALWAQSKLDVEGVGERIEEGHSSGEFDDSFRWELDVSRYRTPDAPPDIEGGEAIELYRLDLNVFWGGRRSQNSRNSHFVTLRAMMPDGTAGLAPGSVGSGSQLNPRSSKSTSSGSTEKE